MKKPLIAMSISIMFFLQLACADAPPNVAAEGSTAPWCVLNPAHPRQGKAVEVSSSAIHIVATSQQDYAKRQLVSIPIREITTREALRLLRNREAVSANAHLYLVRASAFYVDPEYRLNSRLQVYIFPEAKALEVVNTSLSEPGSTPVNFAIVVESEAEVKEADVVCLSAG